MTKNSLFLEYTERLAEEAEGHNHHEHDEADPHPALRQPVPDAYPEGGADYGTDDEGRQTEQILYVPEAGRHVTGSPDEARERTYEDASQEDQGEGYILAIIIVLAPATGGRVGQGYE